MSRRRRTRNTEESGSSTDATPSLETELADAKAALAEAQAADTEAQAVTEHDQRALERQHANDIDALARGKLDPDEFERREATRSALLAKGEDAARVRSEVVAAAKRRAADANEAIKREALRNLSAAQNADIAEREIHQAHVIALEGRCADREKLLALAQHEFLTSRREFEPLEGEAAVAPETARAWGDHL